MRRILRGYLREKAERFIAFRSHWRYAASFCTPGEGHEKGGVEGEVGYFRRNHWVPVPSARDLAELNQRLSTSAIDDEQRIIHGRTETVACALATERERLLPPAAESFDLADVSFPVVDRQRCVLVKTSASSTPLHPGTEAMVKTYSAYDNINSSQGGANFDKQCHGPLSARTPHRSIFGETSSASFSRRGAKDCSRWLRASGRVAQPRAQ